MKVINVASKSSTNDLSDLIIESLEEGVLLKAIGAGAVNQAVKGVTVARQKLSADLLIVPKFFSVAIDGQEKSGISIEVKKEEK